MKKYILATLLTLASAVSGVFAGYAFLPNEVTYQPVQVVHNEAPSLGAVQNTKFVGTLPTTLSGAGITTSAASIGVSSLTLKQSGYLLTISDFGTTAYLTLEPGNSSRQEFASCTGITQNANGTAVFTTCTRGLAPIYPYTASSTFAFVHGGGTTVIVSNSPPFYNNFTVQNNDASITGNYVFSQVPHVSTTTVDADITNATTSLVTYNLLQNTSFAGTVNASTIVKGIMQIATALQASSTTALGGGSTGASLAVATNIVSATPGASLIVMAQSTGKILQGWLNLTDSFTWSGAHTFNTATTTFSATTSFNGVNYVSQFMQLVSSTTINTSSGPVPVFIATSTNALVISEADVATTTDFLGFATSTNVTNGATGTVQISGIVNGFSGLTVGQPYYVSNIRGAISSTVGTAEAYVGTAVSATQILLDRKDGNMQYLGSQTCSLPSQAANSPAGVQCDTPSVPFARYAEVIVTNTATVCASGPRAGGVTSQIRTYKVGLTAPSLTIAYSCTDIAGSSVGLGGNFSTTFTSTSSIRVSYSNSGATSGNNGGGTQTAYFYR